MAVETTQVERNAKLMYCTNKGADYLMGHAVYTYYVQGYSGIAVIFTCLLRFLNGDLLNPLSSLSIMGLFQ